MNVGMQYVQTCTFQQSMHPCVARDITMHNSGENIQRVVLCEPITYVFKDARAVKSIPSPCIGESWQADVNTWRNCLTRIRSWKMVTYIILVLFGDALPIGHDDDICT